jgi:dUTPase
MKKVVTWHEDLKPVKGTPGALCWDLKSAENAVIEPGQIKIVKLGIKTNFAWKLYSRSSLPIKK